LEGAKATVRMVLVGKVSFVFNEQNVSLQFLGAVVEKWTGV